MRIKILTIGLLISAVIMSCDSRERVPAPEASQPMSSPHQAVATPAHKIYVDEVIQAKTYTYLKATEGDRTYWIATAKQPIEAGMTLFFDDGLEMTDFTSKEIDRTFDSILFVSEMRASTGVAQKTMSGSTSGGTAKDISVEKASGGVTVKELYSDMAGFDGKTVTIRGQVTKFNSGIMGRNWVHLQDGTAEGKYYDVTITTDAMVKLNDVVVFQGVVGLNKDFGAGYIYDLIIESATLAKIG